MGKHKPIHNLGSFAHPKGGVAKLPSMSKTPKVPNTTGGKRKP